jgi:hypothetical protein
VTYPPDPTDPFDLSRSVDAGLRDAARPPRHRPHDRAVDRSTATFTDRGAR